MPLPGLLGVAADLRGQRIEAIKALLGPQVGAKTHAHPAIVQIGGALKLVHLKALHQPVHAGTQAVVGHRRRVIEPAGPHAMTQRRRMAQAHIGRRKAQLATALGAVHHPATQRVIPPQQRRGLRDGYWLDLGCLLLDYLLEVDFATNSAFVTQRRCLAHLRGDYPDLPADDLSFVINRLATPCVSPAG